MSKSCKPQPQTCNAEHPQHPSHPDHPDQPCHPAGNQPEPCADTHHAALVGAQASVDHIVCADVNIGGCHDVDIHVPCDIGHDFCHA